MIGVMPWLLAGNRGASAGQAEPDRKEHRGGGLGWVHWVSLLS